MKEEEEKVEVDKRKGKVRGSGGLDDCDLQASLLSSFFRGSTRNIY